MTDKDSSSLDSTGLTGTEIVKLVMGGCQEWKLIDGGAHVDLLKGSKSLSPFFSFIG